MLTTMNETHATNVTLAELSIDNKRLMITVVMTTRNHISNIITEYANPAPHGSHCISITLKLPSFIDAAADFSIMITCYASKTSTLAY